MKKYSIDQLATIVQQLIYEQYNTAEEILNELRANIRGKVKSLHPKELTEKEIEIFSMKVAQDLSQNLSMISKEIISTKLSDDIIQQSTGAGIELSEYKSYFNKFAKKMIKQLLQFKYGVIKKEINKAKRKRK